MGPTTIFRIFYYYCVKFLTDAICNYGYGYAYGYALFDAKLKQNKIKIEIK